MKDPVFADAETRWELGIAKYRPEPWEDFTGVPLEEAYEEYLDIINYMREHMRRHPEDRGWAANKIHWAHRDATEVRGRIIGRNPLWNLHG